MSDTPNPIERAFDNIQGLRRSWANYGLTVGKTALETSAGTLKATADFLVGLSERMGMAPEEGKEPEPKDKWATYGINAGKVALHSGADTLRSAVTFLETLSKRMDEAAMEAEPPEAEPPVEPGDQAKPSA
jgi:hypothetical protein